MRTRVAIDWRRANREEEFGDLTISRPAAAAVEVPVHAAAAAAAAAARGGDRITGKGQGHKGLPAPTRNRGGLAWTDAIA